VLELRRAMERDRQQLAEQVRAALVETALMAYEDAALRGLCCEGAWEVAVSAMRELDLSSIEKPHALPYQTGRGES
jgi:hypothetical protein